jgi:hypothetical protein
MRLATVSVAALLLSLPLVYGQQPRSRDTQPPTPAQASSGRSSYDPMAQTKGNSQPKGIVETTLAGVNPQNKDYGSVIAEWRKEVFETTVNRLYLWSIIVLCVALGTSLLANGWLIRERQRRLAISANIVVQLFNAYIGSRAKVVETIARYNSLVERHNRLSAVADAGTPQRESQEEGRTELRVDFDRAKKDKDTFQSRPALGPTSTSGGTNRDQKDDLEIEALRSRLADYETKLQRKDAQLQAKDNQITNLRGRLTRAHDTLEGERQQNSAAK